MVINILEGLGGVSSLTVTNLNSLATSATAGWRSAAIDNTSNLYQDYEVQVKIAAVNTAPANSKAFYVFASGLLDDSGSDYATTGAASGGAPDGTEGTLTFPDVTTLPNGLALVGVIPYAVQNSTMISTVMSVAAAFNGHVPAKFCLAIVNHSGMTIAASGNYVKIRGVYRTAG